MRRTGRLAGKDKGGGRIAVQIEESTKTIYRPATSGKTVKISEAILPIQFSVPNFAGVDRRQASDSSVRLVIEWIDT